MVSPTLIIAHIFSIVSTTYKFWNVWRLGDYGRWVNDGLNLIVLGQRWWLGYKLTNIDPVFPLFVCRIILWHWLSLQHINCCKATPRGLCYEIFKTMLHWAQVYTCTKWSANATTGYSPCWTRQSHNQALTLLLCVSQVRWNSGTTLNVCLRRLRKLGLQLRSSNLQMRLRDTLTSTMTIRKWWKGS